MNACHCDDYKKNISFLDETIVSAWIHGVDYKGEPFKYCPWCGVKMIEIESDLTVKNSIIEDIH